MSQDAELPTRFAKLVIAELADIHAVVLGTADMAIAEAALRLMAQGDISEEDALARAKEIFEAKRKPRAERFCADLLRKLNLAE